MNADKSNTTASLSELVALNTPSLIIEYLDTLSWQERVHAIAALNTEDRNSLLLALEPVRAAELVDEMPQSQAVNALETLDPENAAEIVENLPSDEQADIVSQLETEDAEKIYEQMDPEDAASLRALTRYSSNCAGGLMQTEYVSFEPTAIVENVLQELRANAEDYLRFDIQYIYVVSDNSNPLGIVGLRELLTADTRASLQALMQKSIISVRDDATLEELQDSFKQYPLQGFPVLDRVGHMLGVIPRSAFEEAISEKAQNEFRQSRGIVGGEELRSLPYRTRVRRRLSWLTVNIGLNLVSASVIAAHEAILSKFVVLAVFLPILSDMSGAAGNQAVAVSIRELSLGLLKVDDYVKVLFKEVKVGLLNGLILGCVIALIANLWADNGRLGMVVGLALFVNISIGVMVGGTLPLLLKAFRFDPALASGLILTTITDTCAFFLTLTFAAYAL